MQPTPVFLPGESQEWWSLMGCHLWGHTELDTTKVAEQQQQQQQQQTVRQIKKYIGGIILPLFSSADINTSV